MGRIPGFVDRRLAEDSKLVLYALTVPHQESNPPGIAPIDHPALLWPRAIETRWPLATVRSADETITGLRRVKSAAEVRVMRRVARASVFAALAGLRALAPGRSQREVEAEVVAACVRAGEGPSFWPWIMSGPNAVFPAPFESFADYGHVNRVMRAGELVRVDVGCEVDHYRGDVGRTAPVSGRFDSGQREAWQLLVRAYHAGLGMMRDGVKPADVITASVREVERPHHGLRTPLGRKVAAEILTERGTSLWELHGVGLEDAEGAARPEVLLAGMTIDFEPMVAVDSQAFYLEDMILITRNGHEVLTFGLPYTAYEIERVLAQGPGRAKSR